MSAPVIAIIGRPNVGKSTFFNRVLGERRAVVHDRPGITRDRNAVRTDWRGRSFVLVDTGGFLPAAAEGREAQVRRQAETAIDHAHAVLFMVDARAGLTDLDLAIARSLRQRGTRCLLVVNKLDKPGDPVLHEFHELGLGEPIPIASEAGLGIGDLLDRVVELLPAESPAPETRAPRISIVGRPNVGKSLLVNALLGEERVVVEPEPGTTMDAIDARWKTAAGDFVLVDTAGIRRQARFDDQSEFYGALRALTALERADLACIVVDATVGFEKQEARLAHEALDAGCTTTLLYNKWDLVEGRESRWKALLADRARRFPTLADLPAMPVSARTGTHLHRLPALLKGRIGDHERRVPTPELNRWLGAVQRRRAAPSNALGKAPRLYYMAQTGIRPPSFALFVNAPSRLSENYRRFLWLQFTHHFGFHGTPVRLAIRKSE